MMSIRIFLPATLILAVALAACGQTESPTQVAARVNGDEVSVHQVTGAIAGMSGLAPRDLKQAGARVLERDIDQELLVRKALATKLDRDPQVMRSIENAKRQILAQAYLDRAMGEALRTSPKEIKEFYDQNPALFGERRIYRVQELAVVMPRSKTDELEAEVAKARRLNDVVPWLRAQQLPFHIASAAKAAEHVPLSLLQKFTEMKDGQITVFAAPQGASIVQLVQSRAAPLTEEQARATIEQFLVNRKRLAWAESEVKRLRAGARIHYVGDFETTRPAAVTSVATARAASSNLRIEESIARGLAGLK